MLKNNIQKVIRLINILLFKKSLPNQIVIYFHETDEVEISAIEDIILFFQNLEYDFVSISKISKNFGSEKKMFSFTFDDGFLNWKNLIPIFDLYDVKATFYLNTVILTDESNDTFLKNIGLDKEEKIINKSVLEELISSNHEIGAHTHSHHKLSNLKFEDFKNEIKTNLDILKQFSIDIKSFAIPFGMRRYLKNEQIRYLENNFQTLCYGEAGMLYKQDNKNIQRYPWQINLTFYQNLVNLSTDTNLFNKFTKRSGLG